MMKPSKDDEYAIMDRFLQLSKTLEAIDAVVIKIIAESIPYLDELTDENSDLVCDIRDTISSKSDFSSAQIIDVGQAHITDLIKVAEDVKRESNFFIKATENGFSTNDNAQECPFLAQVWHGDVYDKVGIDALNELLKELRGHLKALNYDTLVRACAAQLSKA